MNVTPARVVLGSAALLAMLAGALFWRSREASVGPTEKPIVVYAAAAVRVPTEAIAQQFQAETGQAVELRFGSSEDILTKAGLVNPHAPADLLLPADDSYLHTAHDRGLIAERLPIARMKAVVLTPKGNPKAIATFADLTKEGVRVALPNPGAAVGKLVREHVERLGRWPTLKTRVIDMGTVTEAANAAKVGSVDAAIVWDAVAANYPEQILVTIPELDAVTAKVEIAVLRQSAEARAALRFARYLTAKDRGLEAFRKSGFQIVEPADDWSETPKLVLYSGAMLRPAIEETIAEFEKRENVAVTREYNGCGILVSQMKAGTRPDAFFACDPRFMRDAQEWFGPAEVVSNNRLVIAVKKGNPHELRTLKDLGKPNLRVGVGHELQCALGAITKETFLQSGVYKAVRQNVKVESPTGDLLINQLRTGSLDAVVAYISNVAPYDDLEGIAIEGIACAAPNQPYAVGKETSHPRLAARLLDAIKATESRSRFEKLGFGWGEKK